MPIITDGLSLAPLNKGIDEYHVGRMESLGAAASLEVSDYPTVQSHGMLTLDRATGTDIDFGEIATGFPTPGIAEQNKIAAAGPRVEMMDANHRVKQAGLAGHLKLPDQPDIPQAQLDIMMSRATARREREATMERGPGGILQGALEVGTSFLVGAVDPLNLASAFVPVMGELRYAKLLASAGERVASRAAVRASVGAAEGAVGQALLEPIDWMAHTQDGRDFGMADVLHNIMFGAVLGSTLHAGGGTLSDIYRARKERPMYPYDLGEPLESHPSLSELRGEPPAPKPGLPEYPGSRDPIFPEDPGAAHVTPSRLSEEIAASQPTVASPAVQIIDDLPQRAREDAARIGIANLIEGEPLRVGEALEAAAKTDPRIAESFETPMRSDAADISAAPAEPRRAGFPQEAGEMLSSYRDDTVLKAHADYKSAKAGEAPAAARMVQAVVDPATVEQARTRFGADAIYAPVIANEATGHNAIPATLAEFYAARAGGSTTLATGSPIHQTNRAFHTGAGPMERMANPARFAGDVVKGGKYVIVDDVAVMGSTLAAMADHIQRGGGEVVGVVTLANASRTGVLRPSKAHVADIERRYGHEVRDLFHAEPAALTADEAQYVRNFRDADALRAGVASAERKRAERLRAKGVLGEPGEGLGPAPRSVPRSLGAAAQLDRDAAWRALSHDTPEFNDPDVIAASNAAAEVKRPPTKLDERLTAAEKADANAKQMYDMFAEQLPEQDRLRLDDLIKTIDSDHEARGIAIERGAACLFGARE